MFKSNKLTEKSLVMRDTWYDNSRNNYREVSKLPIVVIDNFDTSR